MIQQLINEVRSYFERIPAPTEEERRILNKLNEGYFPITSVHRNDLTHIGFDVRGVKDSDMEYLADKMASDYCDQTFWDSLETIASMCLELDKMPECPCCEDMGTNYDARSGEWKCTSCGQVWREDRFVLVESGQDSSFFEDNYIGYPCCMSEDNRARYVPEYEYIKRFQQTPGSSQCYRAVPWPASQCFMEDEECELINDKLGIDDFGPDAFWVPESLAKAAVTEPENN